jgi:hypothetical protein
MKSLYACHRLALGLLLCALSPRLLAQNSPNVKFGQVSEAEVKMTTYAKDSSASAVVLYDFGDVSFHYNQSEGFVLDYETHVRVKILKKDAFSLGDVKIAYFPGRKERVTELRGFTYNYENGKVEKIKLEKDAIFDEKVDNNYSIKKFALPSIKEGSVIEYSYKKASKSYFTLPVWQFQSAYPVVWSEYRTAVPEYFSYVSNSQTYHPFHISERGDKSGSVGLVGRSDDGSVSGRGSLSQQNVNFNINTNRWVMKDVPAFRSEKFITSRRDCINLIELQLASTKFPNQPLEPVLNSWDKLVEELLTSEDYGGYIDKRGPLKDLVAGLVAGKTTPKEKMEAVYNYVRNTIQYNYEDGIMVDQKLKDVLEKRKGSSAEINLLLVAMLQEAGLQAHSILLSTRWHGKINPTFPILNKFNYSVAYVAFGEEEHLLDATDPKRPIGMLPVDALSEQGLVVARGNAPLWAGLLNRYKASQTLFASLVLAPDGTLKGDMTVTLTGYEALHARNKLVKKEDKAVSESDGEAEEADEFAELKVTYENENEYDKPLKGKIAYESSAHAEVGGDRIYLSPMLDFKTEENPLKADARLFPVDFAYPFDEVYYINIALPEGYVVEEMPKSVREMFGDKTVKYEYLVSNPNPTMIQVICKLNVARALYAPEEYADLKNLFAHFVAKQNEQVVLKKK